MRLSNIVAVICFLITISINGQTDEYGNKDYSDTPIANNGPNIIFIYLDDLGYGDLGNFWQNQRMGDKKMFSPEIDKMANEGAMLTNHYTAAPVCAPARSSLLEGLNQGHASIRNNQFDKPLKNGLNVAQMLAKSGYRTMHIGKAGIAGKRNKKTDPFPDPNTLEAHPLKRGFDQFFGYLYHNQGHLHYPEPLNPSKYSYFTNGYTIMMDDTDLNYTTDAFTAKSKQWIKEHRATRPNQPFFLYLAYDVPHSVLQVPTQAYPAGGGLSGGVQWTSADSPTPYINTASGTKDSYIHPDYADKSWANNEKKFATMIRRVDNAVADIIQLLKDLNIDNKTLIVFSSDNGPHDKNGGNPQSFQSYANLNGIKRDMWEGGIKVSTICRYPGVIPANSIVEFPSGQWDWLATFSELAEVPIPAYTDGVSLMPSLKQDGDNQVDKGYTYHEYKASGSTPKYDDFEDSKRGRKRGQMQVIRMGDYKGVRYNIQSHETPFEIYNVVNDERESTNLASSMDDLQQKMKDKVLQIRKAEDASRPYDNELIPPVALDETASGLEKRIFEGSYEWVPNFEYITPKRTTVSEGIDASGLNTNLGLFYMGYLNIPTDGEYTFYLQSASNCHVMLHEIHLLDNDFVFSSEEQSATLNLKAGLHPIRIFYQQNDELISQINLKLEGPGIPKAIIPNSMFVRKESSLKVGDVFMPASFKIFPQPVINKLNGTFYSNNIDELSANIYTMLGQNKFTIKKNIKIYPGENEFNLPLNYLSKGLYLLVLKSEINSKTYVHKFIKS